MSGAVTLETLQVTMVADVKKFNDEIKKVQNQVKAMTDSVNKQVSKVKSAFASITKSVVGLFALAKVGKYIKNSVQSAMEVEASLQQVARTMGESTQSFLKWAQTNALSFNMAQSDALKFGATYSNLVSSFLTDTNQITGATTELLKASSIIASATGRTMDDVMERIRSGLLGNTEAIEDLGVNVNVALLETTEAFKRLANGKSWNQLSFQTQQQIRLMAILEQTSSKFGDEVFQNTNSSLQQLVAILKDVALNIGNAFLPIANVVIPLLSKMAMWLRTVTGYFAAFMQALFGVKTTIKDTANSTISLGNSSTALGDSIEAAGTKAKRSVAGFDEVNQLQQTDASSSGAGSGIDGAGFGLDGLTSDGIMGELDGIPARIQEIADKIKSVFSNVRDFITTNWVDIVSTIGGAVAGIAAYFTVANWSKIMSGITTAIKGVKRVISGFVSGLSLPALGIAAVVAVVVAAWIKLWHTSEEFRTSVIDGVNGIRGVVQQFWESFLKPICEAIAINFMIIWDSGIKPLWDSLVEFIGELTMLFLDIWNLVLQPFVTWFIEKFGPPIASIFAVVVTVVSVAIVAVMQIISDIIKFLSGVIKAIREVINTDWAQVWERAELLIKQTWDSIKTWLSDTWDSIKTLGETLWATLVAVCTEYLEGLKTYISEVWEGIKLIFSGIIDFITGVFTGDWEIAWEGVKKVFKGIFDTFESIVKTPINAIIGMINKVIDGMNSLSISFPDWIPGVGGQTFGVNIPKIPKLARGGIVDGETNFGNYIAGEAGKEMIVPLENTPFVNKLASALGTAVMQAMIVSQPIGGGGGGTAEVVLKVDGKTFARALIPEFEKEKKRTYNAIVKLL